MKIKMFDKKAQNKMMLKLKFLQSLATLDVTNSSLEAVIFDPKEMLGILDLRSIAYYTIQQVILQQNTSKYYRFESTDIICKQFNKFTNTLKKEEIIDKYLWLDQGDERRNMSDSKILDKYVNLEKSCLSDLEKKEVMNMLYKDKDTFSLRDEIGTCPNIEVK